jgi:hypothetical protein
MYFLQNNTLKRSHSILTLAHREYVYLSATPATLKFFSLERRSRGAQGFASSHENAKYIPRRALENANVSFLADGNRKQMMRCSPGGGNVSVGHRLDQESPHAHHITQKAVAQKKYSNQNIQLKCAKKHSLTNCIDSYTKKTYLFEYDKLY